MPLISVVIPITRYERELEEAVDSVLRQTFQDFEILLVDNNATEAVKLLARHQIKRDPDRMRIVLEEKQGAAVARNRGILESHGRYIALLDSDDRMKSNRLERQLEVLRKDPGVSLVGSWKDDFSPDGTTVVVRNNKPDIPRWAQYLWGSSDRFQWDPLYEPQTSSFFFEKEKSASIGHFDERFDPYWLHDTVFVFRMYEIGKVAIVPEALSEQRMHTEADIHRRVFDIGRIKMHNLFFNVLKEKYLKKGDGISEESFARLRSRWLREAGAVFLSYRSGKEFGRTLIRRALQESPLSIQNWESFIRSRLPNPFYPYPFKIRMLIDKPLPDFANNEFVENLFC